MGYPPPCQPPLVAAGSSSPSFTPKSIFQIVDVLLPRRLLPSGRVSVHLPPKWLAPRVVSIRASRRSPSSLPVAVSRIPTEVFLFDSACRPFSGKLQIRFRRGGPFPPASEEAGGAVTVRGVRFQFCFPKVAFLARFHRAVICDRGCPEELLLSLLPAMHSRWYFCN